ncbi:bifunctional dihydroneopterin aldolase/dihydroneopterin triphosphate 2'-epimerase [Roseivivax sp. THAF40]|uniref:dihydroneopterin aldolase n=1 Tax=unclassified Roseivivax TaxID=2639302 RepID=UPI0012685764|nr:MULTISPECIES: dihydroneopterin aldolase [unclassified Roseivivax]QFS83284.1 bifunctional dihydroneopterin aldolase/dihydroneopterin triphosphate 2'-epimerase [Roseivivax sp. THAF197b]QFT47028.1 bifunctional dihydroneopterin aldolase/dihydroneopterin triphosphate 2'-epimerase [Roseivivax sp. THAF40]
MASEIRLAFSHPAERAIATSGDDPRDRISLRDHVREVEIGAFQAERGTTQRICFNVVVEVRPFSGPIDDDVDRILSYDRVTEAITAELEAERLNLLETLAERIAERILQAPQALRAFIRIEKLDRGPGALGVEIVRSRKELGSRLDERAAEQPHPRILYLSNAAIADPRLSDWIDECRADGAPLILCVGPHDLALPHADHAMVQRRIDLLAIEQNGWMLAARDDRAKVVSARTELDWAMKNGQVCVWAPSKIVLDATQGPATPPGDAAGLAAWFAGQMTARELVLVGADAPEESPVPTRSRPPSDRLLKA